MKLTRKPEVFEVIKFEVPPAEQIPYGTAPNGFMLISGANGPQGLVRPGLFVSPGQYVLLGDHGTAMVVTQAELDEMTKGKDWSEVKDKDQDKDEHPAPPKVSEAALPPRPTPGSRG